MITKFKLYEDLNISKPEVGDYAICHIEEDDTTEQKITDNFLNKNIGILIKIDNDTIKFNTDGYNIKFDNEFDHHVDWNYLSKSFDENNSSIEFGDDSVNKVASFFLDEIVEFGKTKKELEEKLAAKKYNL